MFEKIVAIEPLRITKESEEKLAHLAEEIVFYPDIPRDNKEIIQRIGQADAVLLSYTSHLDREVLEASPQLEYVGMCCSLYSPESANVDIAYAKKKGITVTGVRDYGDEGVVEFVVAGLVNLLHGFGGPQWREQPTELTGLHVGVVGLGTSGRMVAQGLDYFGAELSYYSRTRKPEAEAQGMVYRPLKELLRQVDIVCTCLNKNTVLLSAEEFEALGEGKILVNTGISPSFQRQPLEQWLTRPGNYLLADTVLALGEKDGEYKNLPNVLSPRKAAGFSVQSTQRLGEKVLANVESYLHG